MWYKRILLLFLILSLNFNITCSYAISNYKIQGDVTDTSSNPITDVIIEIIDSDTTLDTTNTDTTGFYKIFIDLLENTEYQIKASKQGYYTHTEPFLTGDGKGSPVIKIDITLTPEPVAPVAEANGPYSGTTGNPVSFTSAGSSDSDGSIVSYLWDFDDGSTSTDANPTYTYTASGSYTVSLTVTDNDGLTDTDTATCTIKTKTTYTYYPSPIPQNKKPVAIINSPKEGAVGIPLNFNSEESYDPDGTIESFIWEFGDGETSLLENPTHEYNLPGSYDVILIIEDNEQSTDTATITITIQNQNQAPIPIINGPYSDKRNNPVEFSADGSYDPDGTIVEYLWDFGDNTTSVEKHPIHIYEMASEYEVHLTVIDDQEVQTTSSTMCIVVENIPPIIILNDSFRGEVNTEIKFSSVGTEDPDGEIIDYLWNFGDGTSSTIPNPTHTYELTGEYTVSLMVTDDNWDTDTREAPCTVFYNKPPIPVITGPDFGYVNEQVHLSSSNSYDPDGEIVRYQWELGDGFKTYVPGLFHEFDETGVYLVSLTVEDNLGKSQTLISEITISEKTRIDNIPIFTILTLASVIIGYLYQRNRSLRLIDIFNQ
jgi:PKD repeat protein